MKLIDLYARILVIVFVLLVGNSCDSDADKDESSVGYSQKECNAYINSNFREDLESVNILNVNRALSLLVRDNSTCAIELLVDLWEGSDDEYKKFNWDIINSDENRLNIARYIQLRVLHYPFYSYNLDEIRSFALNKIFSGDGADDELKTAIFLLKDFEDSAALNNLKKAVAQLSHNDDLYRTYITALSSMCINGSAMAANILIAKMPESDYKERIKERSQDIVLDSCGEDTSKAWSEEYSYLEDECNAYIDANIREMLGNNYSINVMHGLLPGKAGSSVCSFFLLVAMWEDYTAYEYNEFSRDIWDITYSNIYRLQIAKLIQAKVQSGFRSSYNVNEIRDFALSRTFADDATEYELIGAAFILKWFDDSDALDSLNKAALQQGYDHLYEVYIIAISSMCTKDFAEHAKVLISRIPESDYKEKVKEDSQKAFTHAYGCGV